MGQISNRKFWPAASLLLCLMIGSSASGFELSFPSQTETLTMLTGSQFSELDSRFGAVQSAYKSRTISDEDLRAAFRVFYVADPGLESQYLAWLRHSPKSYVAHLAAGIYYKKIGQDRRGGDYANVTSDENMAGMEEAL